MQTALKFISLQFSHKENNENGLFSFGNTVYPGCQSQQQEIGLFILDNLIELFDLGNCRQLCCCFFRI